MSVRTEQLKEIYDILKKQGTVRGSWVGSGDRLCLEGAIQKVYGIAYLPKGTSIYQFLKDTMPEVRVGLFRQRLVKNNLWIFNDKYGTKVVYRLLEQAIAKSEALDRC